MNKVCSIVLVNVPFCIVKAERTESFNGGDLLLMDAISREFFLPYMDFVSEFFISEKILTKYIENYGDLSRRRDSKATNIMRISSPNHELMSSIFSYINTNAIYSDVFYEMIMLSCISLFSEQKRFYIFYTESSKLYRSEGENNHIHRSVKGMANKGCVYIDSHQ